MGPRALGFIRPHLHLNATPFLRKFPVGNLALVSQSGAVCTSILDWAFNDDFALSAVFSPGNGSDLNLPEILDFLASDPRSESILLYLEGIPNSRRFMSSLRAAARTKPVVVVKAGRAPLSAGLAHAHNLAPIGDDLVFDAALRRAGALRVRSIGDLFSAARALTTPRKPQGNRLAIVTNGGGPAIMAADTAAELGISLPPLSPATLAGLHEGIPPSWSMNNPVDLLIDASPQRFATAATACLDDPDVDGVLLILSPNSLFDPAAIAEAVISCASQSSKPLLVCCMGEASVRDARHRLSDAGLPVFRTPESAVTAFSFMAEFVRNQQLLLETPASLSTYQASNGPAARTIVEAAWERGSKTLGADEVAQVLAAFHIPLREAASVAAHHCQQLSVRIRTDGCFGPVIELVPGCRNQGSSDACAVVLPPLNDRLINDLFHDAFIDRLLGATPELPAVPRDLLRRLLLRISELACELPWIDHLEVEPFLEEGLEPGVITAGITLRPLSPSGTRYGHMAICPYPLALETAWQSKDGTPYRVRPIRPEDASVFQEFVRQLSDRSRYLRFFGSMRELPARQLARRTQIDYDREMVLIAVRQDEKGLESVIAEAFYGVLADGQTCEFGVVVADHLAGQGIGSRIMNCLMDAARERGIRQMVGEVLSENEAMQGLMEALGFNVSHTDDPEVMELHYRL